MKNLYVIIFVLLISIPVNSIAQRSKSTTDVYVDKNGVMRWGKSGEEVHGFGVNYTTPFAHAYQVAKQLNIPIEKAIDDDVYHFARLGFDLYRIHMWDTEISDTLGNLLENDHLRLFDYTIMKMKERGMKFIITPIAYWGNGWPAPDEKTPGFASKYWKDGCLTNPEAIKAQEKYLYQLLNHVNPYTKTAYKNDPDIIAFEICNEPHHRGTPAEVTTFINRMVKSMRDTGCKKPIFYNITHSIHLADAYFDANIQGGTFQWYPTGLGFRHELGGNILPNVDRYTVPFATNPTFKSQARIVYEFDAADVGRSYIYPAMARSFREAGMQVATQFAYDPTFMAYANTEYGTHYMNLAFTPQKALSLKIASEVFHKVPRYKNFGKYPANASFDGFNVSYENDLAEMISENKFIYTNTTNSSPSSLDKLEHLAGSGNSPLVKYEGTGAYFLDKVAAGVWRLEVMPDAIWVSDPFEKTSLKKEVAVINWRQWPMTISIPDIGNEFTVKAINDGNTYSTNANGSFQISPGTYLITKKDVSSKVNGGDRYGNILLKEFTAPKTTLTKSYVLHKPASELVSGKSYTVNATIVTKDAPQEVELHVWSGRRPEIIKMEKKNGYVYSATIPDKAMNEGFLTYYIAVKENGKYYTYPSGLQTNPRDWDFYDLNSYKVRVVSTTNSISLFNAYTDSDELVRQWVRGSSLQPLADPAKAELLINIEKLFVDDPENKDGERIHDYSMRYFFAKKIEGRKDDVMNKKELVFRGRSLNDKPCQLQVALIMKDGSTYGGVITVGTEAMDYRLALSELKKVKHVTLPRPYPTFLPYYFEPASTSTFDVAKIESLQISIGPGIPAEAINDKHGIAIESVILK